MTSEERGASQSSYRIVVAEDRSMKSVVWDSGVVASGESVGILYGSTGTAQRLASETDYYWQVEVVDNNARTLKASSTFSTGLMNPTQAAWSGAQWIGSEEFALDAASALLFNITTKMQITEGTAASLVFGAYDFRLSD